MLGRGRIGGRRRKKVKVKRRKKKRIGGEVLQNGVQASNRWPTKTLTKSNPYFKDLNFPFLPPSSEQRGEFSVSSGQFSEIRIPLKRAKPRRGNTNTSPSIVTYKLKIQTFATRETHLRKQSPSGAQSCTSQSPQQRAACPLKLTSYPPEPPNSACSAPIRLQHRRKASNSSPKSTSSTETK